MLVRVLLFGAEADTIGKPEFLVDIKSGSTCASLRSALSTTAPELAARLATCRFAVNGGFAREEDLISADDEIALIGLVSGG